MDNSDVLFCNNYFSFHIKEHIFSLLHHNSPLPTPKCICSKEKGKWEIGGETLQQIGLYLYDNPKQKLETESNWLQKEY